MKSRKTYDQRYMPTSKTKKLILFGTGDLAAIAYEYFTMDSEYEVSGFVVDPIYIKEKELFGLPIVSFDLLLHQIFPVKEYDMHVCIVYGDMNRTRAKKCAEAKSKGYKLASYISSRAFVSPSAKIGEHAFIFENNVIQPFVGVGNNCILWSGNHVGHHSVIGNNVFVSSHVVISGHCRIGDCCFIGVNSTLANNTVIGKESWISHGSIMSGQIPDHSMVKSVTGNTEVAQLNEAALSRALDRNRR